MLIKLFPTQVNECWETIKYCIQQSLPPVSGQSPEMYNNILTALLLGQMTCWVFQASNGHVSSVLTTRILNDSITEIKSLLIFSLYGTPEVRNLRDWRVGLETLQGYAQAEGCSRIIAYSTNDFIDRIIQRLGGNVHCRFVSLPV